VVEPPCPDVGQDNYVGDIRMQKKPSETSAEEVGHDKIHISFLHIYIYMIYIYI